jgi:hypothetical protein
VAQGDQAFLVTGFVRIIGIFDEVENLRPEDRLRVGVMAIE